MSLFIHAIGLWRPSNEITESFLDELNYNDSEKKLQLKLGIRSRRTVLDLDYIRRTRNTDVRGAIEASTSSDAESAAAALQVALHESGLKVPDIGLLIAGSSAPEYVCPAQACIVANELGTSCDAFDLSSACNTALAQLQAVDRMAVDSTPDYIALLQIENVTRSVDYGDAVTAALMGDCTTAIIVSKKRKSAVKLESISYHVNPKLWDAATLKRCSHFKQDGRQIRRFATHQLCSAAGMLSDPECFIIPHQTSLSLLEDIRNQLNIPLKRFLTNAESFGNCASAGAVSVLAERWRMLSNYGGHLMLLTIGAGITWSRATIRFQHSVERPVDPNEIEIPQTANVLAS